MANPFSTRFTRAGAVPFVFKEGQNPDELLQALQQSNWFGQIIGPHGSGKTSLALEIAKRIEGRFLQCRHLTVRRKDFSLQLVQLLGLNLSSYEIDRKTKRMFCSSSGVDANPTNQPTFFLFDGWERVSKLNRYLFMKNCKRFNHGLLVTTHRQKSRLPVLTHVEPEQATFCQIVRQLQRDSFFELDGTIAEQAFDQAKGNYREAFMRLYDAFEREKKFKLQDSSCFY